MSDRKRDNEKKEKQTEMEEMDKQYMEMPHQNSWPMQHMCPMMHQCPMAHQCPMMNGNMKTHMHMPMPMMGGAMMQPMWPQPMQPMNQNRGEGMRVKNWFDEWDEFSEDSSFEFDSDDFDFPEKYYKEYYKKNKFPYFWPPFFPFYKK